MRDPIHLPSDAEIAELPRYTPECPIRLLVSACLAGVRCGADGSSYGDSPLVRNLMALPNVQSVKFCPERFAFGTPRNIPDIHGGNGFDAVDGKARVLSDKGDDLTEGMLNAAQEMLKVAKENRIDIAVLMDMSAACGSQVISDGCRLDQERRYQKGPGVAAALLMRNGFKIISQRDFRTLELLHRKLDPQHLVDEGSTDHHQTDWYRRYFFKGDRSP